MLFFGEGLISPRAPISETLFRRLMLAAMAGGFALLVLVCLTAVWLIGRAQDYSRWVDHTYMVQQQLYQLQNGFERAEGTRRGYLLTGQPVYLARYRDAASAVPRLMQSVRALTGDNPIQQRTLSQLEPTMTVKLNELEQSVLRVRGGDLAGSAAAFAHISSAPNDRIRSLIFAMHGVEARLLEERTNRESANRALLLFVVLSSGLLLVLLAGGSLWIIRRYAGDLQRSEEALRRLNSGLEETVRERTADLTQANEEIQRFAYIVSHDLRAPLVNVLGFTSELETSLVPLRELVTRAEKDHPEILSKAAKEAVNADLPESIGFIRSSSKKMDGLINAILKLSRAGRRNLAPERVDMNAAVRQIAGTLKHQAGQRGAEITLEGELPDLVTDRMAIEQVFANLVENAVKYLKPDRPGRIAVRGRTTPSRLIYEIEDNGRGIDPKDHERIFELFRRAGAQDQPGEGIGLAHVRATIYRLGGTISVESQLDRGATFRVSLPRTLDREQAQTP